MMDWAIVLGQAAVDGAGAGGGDAPVASSKTLLEYIQAGGTIGYLIILLSFVALGLTIAQLIRLRASRMAPPAAVEELDRLLRGPDLQAAIRYCKDEETECFLTRVFAAALERVSRSPFGLMEMRSALEEAGQAEVARLHRGTEAIGVIASVAPMLGLLGTVVGMVLAFDTIAFTKGSATPDQLAGYISLALITTVQGLVVAIPCTAAFSYLRTRIDRLAAEMGELAEQLAGRAESGGGGAGASGGGGGVRRPASPVAQGGAAR